MKQNLVCGVGINDADKVTYYVEVDGVKKKVKDPIYSRWKSMIERCYSEKHQKRFPSYIGCIVCDEWLTFSNFRDWVNTQNWEGKELDKDTLKGSSKIYSPDTCIFIDSRINNILNFGKYKGKLPLGVVENTKHIPNKTVYASFNIDTFIGKPSKRSGELTKYRQVRSSDYVEDPLIAHNNWLKCKVEIYEGYAQIIFDQEKYPLEHMILQGLIANLKHHINNNIEFTKVSLIGYINKDEILSSAKTLI